MKQLIKASGEVTDIEGAVDLTRAQSLVGGYIEFVPLQAKYEAQHWQLIVDEEGLLKDKPVNERATSYINPQTLCMGGIRGDAVLLSDNDRMD